MTSVGQFNVWIFWNVRKIWCGVELESFVNVNPIKSQNWLDIIITAAPDENPLITGQLNKRAIQPKRKNPQTIWNKPLRKARIIWYVKNSGDPGAAPVAEEIVVDKSNAVGATKPTATWLDEVNKPYTIKVNVEPDISKSHSSISTPYYQINGKPANLQRFGKDSKIIYYDKIDYSFN